MGKFLQFLLSMSILALTSSFPHQIGVDGVGELDVDAEGLEFVDVVSLETTEHQLLECGDEFISRGGSFRVKLSCSDAAFPSERAKRRILGYFDKFVSNVKSSNEAILLEIRIGETQASGSLVCGDMEMLKSPDSYCICGRSVNATYSKIVVLGGTGSNYLDSETPGTCSRGSLYGIYELLSSLGFIFLRPFQPRTPGTTSSIKAIMDRIPNKCFKPSWSVRSWHYHTMHPLEITNLLNGWGPGRTPGTRQEFESDLPLYENFVEWLVAQRQNRFEFALLRGESWHQFSRSEERQVRLKILSDMAHDYCIGFGIDSPLAFVQQHAMPLVHNLLASEEKQYEQIKEGIDWIAKAGADFLGLEPGLGEFAKPSCESTLRWMNQATEYALKQYGILTLMKVHCSTGQFCGPEFDNVNYNFLPQYATPDLHLAPHTVQFYQLDDPTPGVYGNSNFSHIKDWMFNMTMEKREVLYFPETEYWVNFDSPVPIFLPIYARSRINDVRKIRRFEYENDVRIRGQMNFDSGFEWGYWLNSVITAHVAYDPLMEEDDDGEAYERVLANIITDRLFMEQKDGRIYASILANLSSVMHETMVLSGGEEGQFPNRTAIAYITGYDMYQDIGSYTSTMNVASTRIRLESMGKEDVYHYFLSFVEPILLSLRDGLKSAYFKGQELRSFASEEGKVLFEELQDSILITALRTEQVLHLYNYIGTKDESFAKLAEQSLDRATEIIRRRESDYSVPKAYVDAWDKENPTVYHYRYLWPVKTQYYWFRDEARAKAIVRTGFPLSPCFRNIENPLEEFAQFPGVNYISSFTEIVRAAFQNVPLVHDITDCLNTGLQEPGPYSHDDKPLP